MNCLLILVLMTLTCSHNLEASKAQSTANDEAPRNSGVLSRAGNRLVKMITQLFPAVPDRSMINDFDEKIPEPLITPREINALRPYFAAIKQIRYRLENIAVLENYTTGFSSWPKPQSFHDRTDHNIFLEMRFDHSGAPIIDFLYTPFGQVKLLARGGTLTQIKITEKFLNAIQWKIRDVSSETIACTNINGKTVKTEKYSTIAQEKLDEDGLSRKLYLIESVGDIILYPQRSARPCKIIVSTGLDFKQADRDTQLLSILSAGRNEF